MILYLCIVSDCFCLILCRYLLLDMWLMQLRAQEIGNINDVLRLSFCAKRLENKVC